MRTVIVYQCINIIVQSMRKAPYWNINSFDQGLENLFGNNNHVSQNNAFFDNFYW